MLNVWERVDGLVSDNQCGALNLLASLLIPFAVIVEIGCFKGKSTISLAEGVKGNGIVIAVEPFLDFEIDKGVMFFEKYGGCQRQTFCENVKRFGCEKVVYHYDKIPDNPSGISMAFIDGNHNYISARSDFYAVRKRMSVGGVVVMHDVGSHAGPTQVWEEEKHQLAEVHYIENMAVGVVL